MAMTAEEQAVFDSAQAKAAEADKIKAEYAALKKDKANPLAPDASTLEKARQAEEESATRRATEKAIADAARFSVSIKETITAGEGFFPDETSEIIKVNAKANFDSELDKANDLRSSLIESVFSQKKNLELMTPSAQEKVNAYLELSPKKRQEKAGEYWEYVNTALDIHNRIAKAERVNNSRAGMSSAPWQKEHEGKLFGLNQKKEGK